MKLQKNNTIKQLIDYGASIFDAQPLYYGHGTDNALDEAAYIVLTVTGSLPISGDEIFENDVSQSHQEKVLELFSRRVTEKIPVAYLVNEAWFAGLPFYVNESVLVPRSPFAELLANEFAPWVNVDQTSDILDLCTGSGCIGIVSALTFPNARVDLADISPKALLVAEKNVKQYKLQDRVSCIQSDLFECLTGKTYDLIVTNPPYVGHDELSTLPDEFYKEPQLGLDGGVSGLDLVHKILAKASELLNDGGVLFVEVGNTDEALQQSYPSVPFLWQDFDNGGHGVFMLTKEQLLEHKALFSAKINGLN